MGENSTEGFATKAFAAASGLYAAVYTALSVTMFNAPFSRV